jgi:L-threonylcarbamoyladenylate synthase
MPPQNLQIDCRNPDKTSVATIAALVASGGVIVYPTDTIYGIGCDAFNPVSVQRVNSIKKRSAGQPLLILIPGLEWAHRLAMEIPPRFDRVVEKFWPGPLTLILRASGYAPRGAMAGGSTIGIRWAQNPFLQALMDEVGSPIVSTSANFSGGEPIREPNKGCGELLQHVDMIVDGGPLEGKESTVIDLSSDPPKVLREGSTTSASLQSVLGDWISR